MVGGKGKKSAEVIKSRSDDLGLIGSDKRVCQDTGERKQTMNKRKKTNILIGGKKTAVFYEGNLDIIKDYPVIGVLASGKAPGPVVWESYQFFYALRDEPITLAGGWHSPLEKGILDALVEGNVNVVFFMAKGLKASGFQQKFKALDKTARALMISPFPDSVKKISGTEGTRLRNTLLAAASDVLFIPYIKPRGKLFSMLKGDDSLLNKTFILNHPENDACSLKVRRIESSDAHTLIHNCHEAYRRRSA